MSATDDNPNPNIGRNGAKGDHVYLRIGCWNIACAKRDEEFNPLAGRLTDILVQIQQQYPPLDVLVLLEAGRASKGVTWVAMAALIEQATGLTYMGIVYTNATENPFGKAYFVRRATCMLVKVDQNWLDMNGAIVAGPENGYDFLTLHILPVVYDDVEGVVKRRVLRDRLVRASFVHLPMNVDHRLGAVEILKEHDTDVIMGDWNTFPDDGGPEMIEMMKKIGWKPLLPPGVMTFKAFPHDLCKKPASYREKINPESEVVSENPDGTINVRFSSPLDHVFLDYNLYDDYDSHGSAEFCPITSASDHALVVFTFDFHQ